LDAGRDTETDCCVPNISGLPASNILEAFASAGDAVPIESWIAFLVWLLANTITATAIYMVPFLILSAGSDVFTVRNTLTESRAPLKPFKTGCVLNTDSLTITVI
jgi:hypothetical protein